MTKLSLTRRRPNRLSTWCPSLWLASLLLSFSSPSWSGIPAASVLVTAERAVTTAGRGNPASPGHGRGRGRGRGPAALAVASSLLHEDPPKVSDPPSPEQLEKAIGKVKTADEAEVEASDAAVAAAKELKASIEAIVYKAREGADAAKEAHAGIDQASKAMQDSNAKIVEPEIKAGLEDASKRFGGASGL